MEKFELHQATKGKEGLDFETTVAQVCQFVCVCEIEREREREREKQKKTKKKKKKKKKTKKKNNNSNKKGEYMEEASKMSG